MDYAYDHRLEKMGLRTFLKVAFMVAFASLVMVAYDKPVRLSASQMVRSRMSGSKSFACIRAATAG
jgi:hypothetical protein